MRLKGTAWRLGDGLKAGGQIIAIGHDRLFMEGKVSEAAKHVLEDIIPDFASRVRPGDILFAGKGFGWGHGHYHPQAIRALMALGVSGVFAESFGGGFARKAINLFGFPAFAFPGLVPLVEAGDEVEVDLAAGDFRNLKRGHVREFKPLPPVILEILNLGGLDAQTLQHFGKAQPSPT